MNKIKAVNGKHSVDHIHKDLGHVMWDFVGMSRTKESLEKAIVELERVRKDFWSNVRVPGEVNDLNIELEKALRLADFIDVGILMAYDALNRKESCGGHFREEYQTPEGEALRDDVEFNYVACWKYTGSDSAPEMIKEPLDYEFIKVETRDYKS